MYQSIQTDLQNCIELKNLLDNQLLLKAPLKLDAEPCYQWQTEPYPDEELDGLFVLGNN